MTTIIKAAAATCTTIGGIEVLSEAALATNALAKDELRRGSHVQVLDDKTIVIRTRRSGNVPQRVNGASLKVFSSQT